MNVDAGKLKIMHEDLARNRPFSFKYGKDRIENYALNNSSIIALYSLALYCFFQCRCLAVIRRMNALSRKHHESLPRKMDNSMS